MPPTVVERILEARQLSREGRELLVEALDLYTHQNPAHNSPHAIWDAIGSANVLLEQIERAYLLALGS